MLQKKLFKDLKHQAVHLQTALRRSFGGWQPARPEGLTWPPLLSTVSFHPKKAIHDWLHKIVLCPTFPLAARTINPKTQKKRCAPHLQITHLLLSKCWQLWEVLHGNLALKPFHQMDCWLVICWGPYFMVLQKLA